MKLIYKIIMRTAIIKSYKDFTKGFIDNSCEMQLKSVNQPNTNTWKFIMEIWKSILKYIKTSMEIVYIKKCAKYIFKCLNIEPIEIDFNYEDNCFYSSIVNRLFFGIEFLNMKDELLEDCLFKHIKHTFKNRKEKLFFVVAHEIGHYYQGLKFPIWKDKYLKQYHTFKIHANSEQHRKLHIEANADKIALALFNKDYKNLK